MSSNDFAIRIQDLSKCFQIYKSPRDRLKQFFAPLLPRMTGKQRKQYFREFWALRNITFEVKKGETLGIIGRNGAGKSTLLQLICGTLSPSSGSVDTSGRVAALLELGAGFNPEFTGRENVYMSASILGLSNEEIDTCYDDVLAFADIGSFIDQPVKNYSSGMYVRLAFAVNMMSKPDIMIVDEALAVGDMLFQAKCMIRLKQMIDSGVSVLFVSHDTTSVRGLCQKAVLLEKGTVIDFGETSTVVDKYIAAGNLEINQLLDDAHICTNEVAEAFVEPSFITESNTQEKEIVVSTGIERKWPDNSNRYGDNSGRIIDIQLLDEQRRPVKELEVDQPFIIQVSLRFTKTLPNFVVGYSFRDLKGQMVVAATSTGARIVMPAVNPNDVYVVEMSGKNILTAGIYTLSVGLESSIEVNVQHSYLDVVEHAAVFQSNFHPDPVNLFPSMVKVPSSFTVIKVQ